MEEQRIQTAIDDPTIFVISPTDDLCQLEKDYHRYLSLPIDDMRMSDDMALKLYNKTNHDLYFDLKSKLTDTPVIDKEETDASFEEDKYDTYANNAVQYVDGLDELSLYKYKLNMLNTHNNGSLLESEIAINVLQNVDDEIEYFSSITSTVPEYTPFLTPTEIEDYLDGEIVPNMQSFLDEYKRSLANGLADFNGEEYKAKIQELFSKIQNEKQSYTINKIEEQLISLGWNPNVVPTEKSFKFARERIMRYMDENYQIHIMDISNISYIEEKASSERVAHNLEPIFIVLTYTETNMGKLISKVQNSTYSHACLSFNSTLKPLYSYKREGFTFENFDDILKYSPNGICKVLVMFVTPSQKRKMETGTEYYILNKDKTKYDLNNLISILFNRKRDDKYSLKQVCSQFVHQILSTANANVFDKSNNLVTPDDFDKTSSSNVYIVYEGRIDKYNPKKVNYIIDDLLIKNNMVLKDKYTLNEAVSIFSRDHFSSYEKQLVCDESEIEANKILDKMHTLMIPQSILIEAKRLPFQINSKGIIIDLPIKLEEQYQEIHKTMLTYEKQKSYEQMKPELARLWYLNLVSERKIKEKEKWNKQEEAKKIRDTRARIMNDFKKYLKLLLTVQPDFDFATYFEGSRYNDRKLFIDKDTLVNSGLTIAKIVKTISA